MEKQEKQLTYETPEVEALEIRMENAITDSCPEVLPGYNDCTSAADDL